MIGLTISLHFVSFSVASVTHNDEFEMIGSQTFLQGFNMVSHTELISYYDLLR